MSIVKMQKVAVLGLDTYKDELIQGLIDMEAVEISDVSDRLTGEFDGLGLRKSGGEDEIRYYETKIVRANTALEIIEKYGDLKKPLFPTRRPIESEQKLKIWTNDVRAEDRVERLIKLRDRIKLKSDEVNRLDLESAMLRPWEDYSEPLENTETETVSIIRCVLPKTIEKSEFETALSNTSELLHIEEISEDKDMRYLVILCMKDEKGEVLKCLDDFGIQKLDFAGISGTASWNIEMNRKSREDVLLEVEDIKSELKELASDKELIENYADILAIEIDKKRAKTKILNTARSFFLEGWIPAGRLDDLQRLTEGRECYIEVREPLEDEEVPVLLKNSNFFSPIETVTEMYSLPAYGSFDPTSIYALFYICFFGMMFSDAGYGILMTVICYIFLKKFDLEGSTYKMVKGFMYCGVSTFFWGAMFGGWFGDFFEVFARVILGKEIDIKPIWFDPLDDPLKLLIFSLILGVIHLFIGMGIAAYMKIRDGKILDAVFDVGLWYITIIGAIMLLAGGSLSPTFGLVGKWMFIVGLVGLLLTGGRDRKGFGKVIGGLSNVYSITSYMSDILSYARILALGLATGVIAQVVNTMGSLAGGGFVGAIVLLVIFTIGHLLNFAINVLGAFIHSSRLQYVEFFGKFYVDGGEPFEPFRRNTKYIKIESQKS